MSIEMLNTILDVNLSEEEYEVVNALFAACPGTWTYDDMAAAWKAGEKSRNRREKGDDKVARAEERETARQNRMDALIAKHEAKVAKAAAKAEERERKEAEKQAAKIQKLTDRLDARLAKDSLSVWVDGMAVEVSAETHPELIGLALSVRGAGFIAKFPVNGVNYEIMWAHLGKAVKAGEMVPEYYAM